MTDPTPQGGTPDPNKFKPKAPAAVAEAARRAEEIMAQMKAAETPLEITDAEDPAIPPPEVEDPPQQPIPVEDPPPQEAAPEPSKEPPKPKRLTEAEWEQRLNSMKGRYDNEVARTNQMTQDIMSLRKQISGLEARINPKIDATKTVVPQITPEEEEAYGKDLLEVVAKKAMAAVQPHIDALTVENERLKARLEGVGSYVAASAEEQMHQLLDTRVPSWRQMNTDQEFIDWLKYPDAYSGQLRQEMLNDAYSRQDASRVVAFFEGYLREAQVTAPSTAEAPVPAGVARGAPAKPPLSKFAAPGKGKSAAPSSPVAEKPIYTSAWITRFYADVAAGRWRGREAEKAAIENDIFVANSEGRVH